MPKQKPSMDEVLERRKSTVIETDKGVSLVKTFRSPPSFKKADDGLRTARFVMSTEEKDRYGDVVRQTGIDTSEFDQNPICLFMHSHRDTPLGQWGDLKVVNGKPKRTEGTLTFAPEGEFADVDKVAKLVEHGIYRACSIGFMAGDIEFIDYDDSPFWGVDFLTSTLTECSVVAVGANQSALAKAAEYDKQYVLSALEDVLDNWAKTADGLVVPRDQFERVYAEISAKTVSTPELRECAVNPEAVEDDDETESITIDVDTSSAEKKLDGLHKSADSLLVKFGKLAGFIDRDPPEPVEPEYVEGALEAAKAARAAAEKKLAATEAA